MKLGAKAKKVLQSVKNSRPIQFMRNERLKLKNWVLNSFEDTYRGLILISIVLSTSVIMGIVHMYFPSLPWVVCGLLSLAGA
ncbi:MAG: hypothetical protein PUC65_01905, partial [Clostridiales bacterium]|nr:hypothetical protein [Clostridiales bacterium]